MREKPASGCVFCDSLKSADDEATLIVYRGEHNFIILNLYPYNNGHVMVVPNAHVASPSAATREQRAELMDLATACEDVMREVYRPEGINMGMNLGQAAGAGVEAHYHLHVVPRWAGDTNFMAVTAGTRIIPEDLPTTRSRLRETLLRKLGPEGRGLHA